MSSSDNEVRYEVVAIIDGDEDMLPIGSAKSLEQNQGFLVKLDSVPVNWDGRLLVTLQNKY